MFWKCRRATCPLACHAVPRQRPEDTKQPDTTRVYQSVRLHWLKRMESSAVRRGGPRGAGRRRSAGHHRGPRGGHRDRRDGHRRRAGGH